MNFPILTIILTTIYTFLVLLLTTRLLSYDFIINKIIYLSIALTPIIIIIIIALQNYWLVIGILALVPTSRIPLPLLDALSFNYVINAGILILIIAEITIKKRIDVRVLHQFPSKAMFIFFLWTITRFIYDRPGAGSTGTTGGLSSALPTLLSGACYFSILSLALKIRITKQHIKFLIIGLVVCLLEVVYKNLYYFIPRGVISLFSFPALWFLSFLIITYPLRNTKNASFKNEVLLAICSITIIITSVLSLNRLPLVSAAVALGVAYALYGALHKYIRILIPAFIIIFAVVLFKPDAIPKSAIRTLSLITPSSLINKNVSQELGEIGWESNWRTSLARIAWIEIKEKPITGKGFAFSQNELYYNAVIANAGEAGRFGGLLSSGGYHNGLLFLAVKLGMPIAILFICIIANIYARFLAFSKRLDNTTQKQFTVMLSAAFICMLGKMLTNGGPLDIFNISIILGVMQGVMLKDEPDKDDDESNAQKESLGDSLIIKHIERKNRLNIYKK